MLLGKSINLLNPLYHHLIFSGVKLSKDSYIRKFQLRECAECVSDDFSRRLMRETIVTADDLFTRFLSLRVKDSVR